MSRIVLTILIAFLALPISQIPAASAETGAQAPSGGTYWCPMHPNIRGSKGDHCRICHMALVPAPPPDYSSYHLSIDTFPHAPRVGKQTRIRLTIGDPHTSATVKKFETVHDRLLHLFIVSQDLDYFAHVHPTLQNGIFVYDEDFPRAGVYRLIADFLPTGGSPQLVQQTVVTSGYEGSLIPAARPPQDLADKIIDGVRTRVSMPAPVAGREQLVTAEFLDASTGTPISDLQPYLGAVGHMFLVSADFQMAAHSHPVADMSGTVGPTVVFQALFPRPGTYRFWIQVQRRDRIITVPFTVAVRSREAIAER